jgi:hypothetical protein
MIAVTRRGDGSDFLTVSLVILWAMLGVAVAVVYPSHTWQATIGVLMITQGFCVALARKRLRLTADAILPDFLTVYLVVQFVRKSLTVIGLIVTANADAAGTMGQYLVTREAVPMEYLFRAELVFLLGTVVFALVWRLVEGKTPLAVRDEPAPSSIWLIYGIAILPYLVLSYAVSSNALGMTQDLMKWLSLGSIAVLLCGRSRYALGNSRGWMAAAALLPLYVLALRSGMKGEVGLVSLPILLAIVRQLDFRRVALLGAFAMFVVMFVFPFSQAWRFANWDGYVGNENAGIVDVSSRVFDNWQQNGILETAAEGSAQWLSRGSSAQSGGRVMQLTERDGHIGAAPIQGLLTIFIPRFLWPDKPAYAPGAWFTWYLGEASSPETATSATAMMLPTELYWMFGTAGVVIGMALLAVLNFQTWRYLIRRSATGLVPLAALSGLLALATGLEETFLIYALSAPIIFVVYVSVFDHLHRYRFFSLPTAPARRGVRS